MGFDMSKVKFYNYHRIGHFARECRSPEDIRRSVSAEPQRRNVPAEKEPTNYAFMAFTSSSSSSSDNEDAPNVNKTIHTAFNVKLRPTKPNKDLYHRPSSPIIEDWVSDSEDDSQAELPQNAPSFVQPTKQVKTSRPSVKPVEYFIPAANHKTAIPKPKTHGNSRIRKACFVWKLGMEAEMPNLRPCFLPIKCINDPQKGNPQHALKDKEVIDSGCSRHMTGNMSYLSDFKEINGGYVAFGGNPKGGKISSKGKIKTGKLDFDDVYLVKELKFNLFSVSQMCDKKNNFLFTNIECIVLSPEFKMPDENQVLLRVP
nr:ribonuclease H-like domain-containing protein [Tanacetum cinerariifolium]